MYFDEIFAMYENVSSLWKKYANFTIILLFADSYQMCYL